MSAVIIRMRGAGEFLFEGFVCVCQERMQRRRGFRGGEYSFQIAARASFFDAGSNSGNLPILGGPGPGKVFSRVPFLGALVSNEDLTPSNRCIKAITKRHMLGTIPHYFRIQPRMRIPCSTVDATYKPFFGGGPLFNGNRLKTTTPRQR